MADTASAPSIATAGTNTTSAPTLAGGALMPTAIAAMPTVATTTMATLRRITTGRAITDGLITRGPRQSPTAGAGVERPGMAITAPTGTRTRYIRARRSG